jgi:hypothetical protein
MPFSTLYGFRTIGSVVAAARPWPVWGGSASKPVHFKPMPKRQAVRLWHDARRFERQTRKPGRQDGALGRNGLAVLYALLFDFLNHATGQLDPTRKTLAKAANISIRSVDRGLAALKAAGVLDWVRRFSAASLTQIASAYFVQAQTAWRGFWRPPDVPTPYPEAWGATPPLPGPISAAAALRAEGASLGAICAALESDPRDPLTSGLARWGRLMAARKP